MMVMQIIIDSVSTLKHLSKMASGDIFMRLSSCSPPSNRLARPGHCSRLIWLKRPILIICQSRPRTRCGVPLIRSFASMLTMLQPML